MKYIMIITHDSFTVAQQSNLNDKYYYKEKSFKSHSEAEKFLNEMNELEAKTQELKTLKAN